MSTKLRIAIIDKDKCKPKKCAKECMKRCVINQSGKQCIEIEEIAKVSESLCIGCNQCVAVCPFNAIKIVNLPSQLANDLVYSYGENLFRLYKLPNPKMGKIIGILGQNGIGKSTLLNILAGNILPNYGSDNITENQVLKNVRGNELQKYLKLLYDKKLKISVKPQNILGLINNIKKSNNNNVLVGEILSKYSNLPNYDEVVKVLELDKIMDNKVILLSGGELQKLVCAINIIKPADVYIFDEPTNYLDIEYRIKIANLIKNISSNQNYVFVVEHDLSILDFVADYIHIMYGEPGAYGCISTLYNTLEAINIYFDGYIPADNMRFRSQPYTLSEMYQIDDHKHNSNLIGLISYADTVIKFDNFELNINPDNLSNEINMIIILGKNGVGKSTYLNFLNKTLGLNISYKPQINDIKINDNVRVKDYLYNEIKESMVSSIFDSDVIKLLGINKLYNKKIKKLSGGELQRLSITLCLGKKADVYLIDEPSANLDIEQRFNCTKVIKRFLMHNKKIGFIVEHDILMAISLAREQSSKIMVFEEIKCENNIRYCQNTKFLDFNIGINRFLKNINTTFRTHKDNNRPKINKLDSVADKEQKQENIYYK